MDADAERRWHAHCHRMAEATYAIADWCEDPDMMRAYLDLAAKWTRMAGRGAPQDRNESEDTIS
jgi:hypothetical protein